jgi:hypothetical protein
MSSRTHAKRIFSVLVHPEELDEPASHRAAHVLFTDRAWPTTKIKAAPGPHR